MSSAESERKAARVAQLVDKLASTCGNISADDIVAFWVPGRIEVLGKHTDYGGGRSLLCAVERGICIVACPSRPQQQGSVPLIHITDANSGETIEVAISPDVPAIPGHWSNYAITVARRIAMNFSGPLRGADMIFSSDLPYAAGVSSSSALVVAIFLALAEVNDLASRPEYRRDIHTPEDLAGYLGCVENGLTFKSLSGNVGVGTFGGSEDQTAILCAKPNMLVQYSFCPVRFERAVPIPSGCTFVIASSGVAAEKTGAALEHYNRVSRRLSVGLAYWNATTRSSHNSMGQALLSGPDAANRIRDILRAVRDAEYPAESLLRRFEQFVDESEQIIPAAGDALASGHLTAFGDLVAQSQTGATIALENQIPETLALIASARELGAIASSAFGAGFGGSVWAMVSEDSVESFARAWSSDYAARFPERSQNAEFFSTRAGPAAMRLE
jgi:galactokinase